MTDRRLVAAMGKMSSDNENERAIGLKAATTLLKGRGLTWPQVAEMITGRTLAEMTAPANRAGNGEARAAEHTKPTPESPDHDRQQRSTRPGRVDGASIPAKITGKVRIIEETAGGLVVEMMGSGWWGPMVARHEIQRNALRIAADRRNPREATVITAFAAGAEMVEIIDVKVRFPGT